MTSVLRSNPEATLPITTSFGVGGASIGCLRLCVHFFALPKDILILG
jgi:hypothetical protein